MIYVGKREVVMVPMEQFLPKSWLGNLPTRFILLEACWSGDSACIPQVKPRAEKHHLFFVKPRYSYVDVCLSKY